MPRALITGGTGFLGTHLAAGLGRAGYEVRLLDVNEPAQPSPDHEFVEGDVRDPDVVRRAARGCELVVDNAALVPVTRASPAEFRAVNLDGARHALEAARAEDAYLIHVSSSSIYGVPDSLPVTEDAPFRPFEPYGVSKAEAERLVERERSDDFPIASLCSRALLGAGRLGVFELVFRRVRAGKLVPMFGRGDARMQMCDVHDFVAAAVAAARLRANGFYNVAAAEFGTVREDLEKLIRHARTPARPQPVPLWAIRAVMRPLGWVGLSPLTEWHLRATGMPFYMDLSKARRELGWEPTRSNAQAMAAAYDEWASGPGVAGRSAHHRPLQGRLARMLGGG